MALEIILILISWDVAIGDNRAQSSFIHRISILGNLKRSIHLKIHDFRPNGPFGWLADVRWTRSWPDIAWFFGFKRDFSEFMVYLDIDLKSYGTFGIIKSVLLLSTFISTSNHLILFTFVCLTDRVTINSSYDQIKW